MNRIATSLIAASLVLGVAPLLLSTPARADTLQTQTVHSVPLRVKVQKEQRYNLPKRGMTMDQVKREYGAPEKSWRPAAAVPSNSRRSIAGSTRSTSCTSNTAM